MNFHEYLSEIGVSADIIQMMKDDKIDERVVILMSDSELGRYLQHKGHRVLAVHFCNKSHGDHSSCDPDMLVGKFSQRRKELFVNIKRKLELSRRSKSLKDVNSGPKNTFKNVKEERKVEIGWCHYDKKVCRYVQVRKATGGGTRFPCLPKSATKDVIIDSVRSMFLPLDGMKVHFELSLDVKGYHMVGEDETVGSLYDKLQLRCVRFYLLSKEVDEPTEKESALDSILPLDETLSDMANECILNDSYAATLNVLSTTSEDRSVDMLEDINKVVDSTVLDSFQTESDAADQTVHFVNMGTPTVWRKIVSAELCIHENLEDALFELSSGMEEGASEKPNIVNVSRDNVLDGGFRAFGRKEFKPSNKLNVKFSGEQGIDNGGPTREFLRLANSRLKEKLFCGPANHKYLMLSASAVTEKQYEMAGKIIGYSIVHRGPLPRYFGGMLYSLMVSGLESTHSIEIDEDILESPTSDHLQALAAAESHTDFYDAVEKLLPIVELSGCGSYVMPSRKDELAHHLKHFLVFGRMKEALEQFMLGLSQLGVLEMIRRCPRAMKDAFTYEHIELDASAIECLFPVKMWSSEGSNRRINEERAISQWNDYLIDAEDEEPTKLKVILKFATGSEEIPILGFNPCAFLGFKHPEDVVGVDAAIQFPMANTCANMILLPILIDYKTFCSRMDAAIAIESFTTD